MGAGEHDSRVGSQAGGESGVSSTGIARLEIVTFAFDNQMTEPAITPELVQKHNLTPDEYAKMKEILGREPSYTELGIFSVMWSEHCSYKNTRPLLKTFPTKSPKILVGAGEENAGIIDIGDGLAIAFKIESHNHPSAVEPFQGAATGVGGIIRDIFTMGARPVCSINSLRFGPITEDGPGSGGEETAVGHASRITHHAPSSINSQSPITDGCLAAWSRASRIMATASEFRPSRERSISTSPTMATPWSTPFASECCATSKLPVDRPAALGTRCSTSARRPGATGWRARHSRLRI